MTSYPPTLDELRATFISEHPGYTFVNLQPDSRYEPLIVPVEPASIGQYGRRLPAGPNEHGERYIEWLKYISAKSKCLIQENGIIVLPQYGQMTQDPHRHLSLAEYYYRQLCASPELRPAALIERVRQSELAKLREQQRKEQEESNSLAAIERAVKADEKRKEDALKYEQEVEKAKEWAAAQFKKEQEAAKEKELIDTYRQSQTRKQIPKKIRGEAWKAMFGPSTEGACFCCRKSLEIFDDWHAGHIVAQANGGPDTAANLRPVCASCNLSMGTENMDEFKARCYP